MEKETLKIPDAVKMTFEYIKQNGLSNFLIIGGMTLKMIQKYYCMSVPLPDINKFLQLYCTVGKGSYTLIVYFSSFVYYSELLFLF